MIATFPMDSIEGAIADVLALGPEIEVLGPKQLRLAVAERARGITDLYAEG